MEVLRLLREAGSDVGYSDPHVPVLPKTRRWAFELQSVPMTPEALSGYDAVVLLTDHKAFDKPFILKHSKLVIDTRGAFLAGPDVVKA